MYCPKCGALLPDSAIRCEKCGEAVNGGGRDAFSYDYKTVVAGDKAALEIVDSYQALGWEVVNHGDTLLPGYMSVNFKRNRKIKNKEQLNRLQVKLDDAINNIAVLEKKKTQSAVVTSLVVGIIGALIFGGGLSLCLLMSALWSYVLGGVLSAAGLAVCGLGYLSYVKVRAKKTVEMDIYIDKKRDEISQICEEARKFF